MVDQTTFHMPMASFNPNPMRLCLFTDGLPQMPLDMVLEEAAKMGIEELEIGTGRYSCAPHIDMRGLFEKRGCKKRVRE